MKYTYDTFVNEYNGVPRRVDTCTNFLEVEKLLVMYWTKEKALNAFCVVTNNTKQIDGYVGTLYSATDLLEWRQTLEREHAWKPNALPKAEHSFLSDAGFESLNKYTEPPCDHSISAADMLEFCSSCNTKIIYPKQEQGKLDEFRVYLEGLAPEVFISKQKELFPRSSEERKQYPIAEGVMEYFPLTIIALSKVSYLGSQKHNPGQPTHLDRSKSTDDASAMFRHYFERGTKDPEDDQPNCVKMAWRSMLICEKELEEVRDGKRKY
jgi:hypothetical protein